MKCFEIELLDIVFTSLVWTKQEMTLLMNLMLRRLIIRILPISRPASFTY